MSISYAAALATVLVVASASLAANQTTSTGATASPLTLSVGCTGSGEALALRVRLENKSNRELAVVLGKTIATATGPTHVIDSLSALTIRPLTGATEAYPYVNPKHASLTGRSTPWIVKVPPGQAHELDAPVSHFISGMTYTLLDPSALAGTRLAFDGRRASGAQVWIGTLEVPIEC